MTEKFFPLEKILTVSLNDYINYSGLLKSAYDLIGIHSEDDGTAYPLREGISYPLMLAQFGTKVPSNAIVVVDFMYGFGERKDNEHYVCASGTAIVPKAREISKRALDDEADY